MKKKVIGHSSFAFYFVCVLCALSCASLIFLIYNVKNYIDTKASIVKKEIEYVYVTLPTTDTKDDDVDVDAKVTQSYLIKEYMGKVGIFEKDGSLVRVIEVYTKTLPEADRRLLGEGFEIVGDDQLNSIIEDYSS